MTLNSAVMYFNKQLKWIKITMNKLKPLFVVSKKPKYNSSRKKKKNLIIYGVNSMVLNYAIRHIRKLCRTIASAVSLFDFVSSFSYVKMYLLIVVVL